MEKLTNNLNTTNSNTTSAIKNIIGFLLLTGLASATLTYTCQYVGANLAEVLGR